MPDSRRPDPTGRRPSRGGRAANARMPAAEELARALLELWQGAGGRLTVRDAILRLAARFGACAVTGPDGRLDFGPEVLAAFRRLAGPGVAYDSGARAWRVDRRHGPHPPAC
jgi:hypothetical protein